jgi:AraC family transcriptional regulator of adaptative response/methylated-DNA-[protein]-cysteine methyltransferase
MTRKILMKTEQPVFQLQDIQVSLLGELRDNLQKMRIEYGFFNTWFGPCLGAFSGQGLCWLEPESARAYPQALAGHWAGCELVRDDLAVKGRFGQLLTAQQGSAVLHMTGTKFQLRVWEALLAIPFGGHLSYGELAANLGIQKGARAVGSAVGKNHIAWFVPCHRVLPVQGGLGGYRWGEALKQRLLQAEETAGQAVAAGVS